MPVNTLKDKLDGNELDLSLSSLEVVPVKEIKELPKATHLDLSCNLLVTIPKEFSLLTHIVRLDLSKNKLTSLPINFGNLSKLQYLDLFQNELSTLPVSMCRLDKLRWLDVKDNPIHDTLKSVAGDCLNEAQCKACAKNIVAFMKKADAAQEKERQAQLQAEREQEKKKKAEEEKEKEKIRQLKKLEKERKRQKHEEKMRLERQKQAEKEAEENLNGSALKSPQKSAVKREKGGLSCCGVFFAFLIGLAAVLFGLYYYCSTNQKDQFCRQATELSQPYIQQVNNTLHQLLRKATKLLES